MSTKQLFASLKAASFLILLLMVVAMIYASGISIMYWSGIGV